MNPALEESERGQEMPSGDQRGQRGIYPDSSASAVPAGGTDVQSVRRTGQTTTQGKSSKTLDWMKSFSRSLAPWEAGLSRAGMKRWGRGSENPLVPWTLTAWALSGGRGVGMEDLGFRLIMKNGVVQCFVEQQSSGGRRLWEVLSDPRPGVASCRILVLTLGAPTRYPGNS